MTKCACRKCNPYLRGAPKKIHQDPTKIERITERPATTPAKKIALECTGRAFAKSCNLPDGVIDHQNPNGFIPVEKLADYGMWAVLTPGVAASPNPIPLRVLSTSGNASTFLGRLGGSLSLLAAESSAIAGGLTVGSVDC